MSDFKKQLSRASRKDSFTWLIMGLAVFLILLGLAARLVWLRYIPFSYYHDELDYVFTGEALARFGTNISGDWTPWKLAPEITSNVTGELPALFQAVTQSIFGLGPQSGHYTSAIFGLLTVALVGYIAWSLWGDKRMAFWSAICVLVTPWSIHISRLAYEAPISLFFQLLLVLSLVKIVVKPVKDMPKLKYFLWITLGFVAVFFAYYTYHAAKVLIPCLLISNVLYAAVMKKSRKVIIPLCLMILFVGGLLARTQQQIKQGLFLGRDSEFITTSSFLKPLIDEERLNSLELPGTSLAINKGTIIVREAIKRYVSVFDLYRLGINGLESGFQFSLAVAGFFFISVMGLMVYGIQRAVHAHDSAAKYILLLVLVSPAASVVVYGFQSIFRSALTYILLLILAGYALTKLSLENKYRWVFIGVLCCMLVELGMFTHQYMNRYGVISAENHYFGKKLLAGYQAKVPQDRSIVIVGEQAYTNARALVSYTGIMPKLTLEERQQFRETNAKTYTLGKTKITETCEKLDFASNTTYIIEGSRMRTCGYADELAAYTASQSGKKLQTIVELPAISSQVGSGTYFNIINDSVCEHTELPHFVRARKIQSFDPVSLSAEEYCTTWLKLEGITL